MRQFFPRYLSSQTDILCADSTKNVLETGWPEAKHALFVVFPLQLANLENLR